MLGIKCTCKSIGSLVERMDSFESCPVHGQPSNYGRNSNIIASREIAVPPTCFVCPCHKQMGCTAQRATRDDPNPECLDMLESWLAEQELAAECAENELNHINDVEG